MQTSINQLSVPKNSLGQITLALIMLAGLFGLTGCQLTPPQWSPKPIQLSAPLSASSSVVIDQSDVPDSQTIPQAEYNPTTPQPEFGYPALVTQALPALPAPPQPQVVLRDGQNIPLVQQLMAQGLQQLQLKQLDNAEETFIHVQRIAPQYASVYARLSELALKRKAGAKAESMARRGLVLTKSPQQKSGFWQLIALAGAMQNKPDVVNEANRYLHSR